MTQQSDLATMFLLSGENIKVSYYINEDGSSQLDYQDADLNLTFTGNQVRIQQSEIGTLISVSLKTSVDAGATTFTLVLPQVKLGGEIKQPLETFGIMTQNYGILPRVGAQLTNRVVQLQGTAQYTDY